MIRKYTEEPTSPAVRGDLEVEISHALRDFFAGSDAQAASDCDSAAVHAAS